MFTIGTLSTGIKYRISTCAHGAYVSFLRPTKPTPYWSNSIHLSSYEEARGYVTAEEYIKENAPSPGRFFAADCKHYD